MVDRESATVWAGWFRVLGDPSRVLLLNRLAVARRPMSVGELVDELDIGQSTVSHHLKLLAASGFILLERQGNASYYRINEDCLECFPSVAELVMGQLPRYKAQPACYAPWQEPAESSPTASRARGRAGKKPAGGVAAK